jgi:hypothetical protein
MIRNHLQLPPKRRFDFFDFELEQSWDRDNSQEYYQAIVAAMRQNLKVLEEQQATAKNLRERIASRNQWHSYWRDGMPPLDHSDGVMK